MGLIRVSATELKARAAELQNLNSQFKANVNELASAEGTLNGMWDGEANDAFHTAFNNDKIQMDNFYNAIQNYVNNLLQIAARYAQAEAANIETANTRKYR